MKLNKTGMELTIQGRMVARPTLKNQNTESGTNLDRKFVFENKTFSTPNYDKSFLAVHNLQNLKTTPSFTGYYGDPQPLKKLFWICTNRNDVYEDERSKEAIYSSGYQKWVNINPAELLKRTPEQAVQSACTITKRELGYPEIPDNIGTPNWGDKWGRKANYIEINPRTVGKYEHGRLSDGLLSTMKLLAAIPPSGKDFPNCIVLSQLYPSMSNDGYASDGSLYCANLHVGISKNLTSDGLEGKMGADEQVKAFNDYAHMLGFKTCFRMPLSAGQLSVQGREFDWYKDERAYIDACVWGIELGFDGIYFDSGKHVIDYDGYMGVGALPNPQQMAYITNQIRVETGRCDLSFIGEKANDDGRFKEIGLSAGTDWGKADNIESVKHEAWKQRGNADYAAGPEVSNDNDCGGINFETRLNRINSCLWGATDKNDKLPTYMQIHDIFPLSPFINTHEAMLNAKQMNGSDAWTECERHWDGIFNQSEAARNYTQNVYHEFENYIRNS